MFGKTVNIGSVKRVALVATLFTLLLSAVASLWFYSYTHRPAPPLPDLRKNAVVDIPPGATFFEIEKILANAGLVNDDLRFYLLARIMGVAHKIKAGEFKLTAQLTPADLLRELTVARIVQHAITIPEGLNVEEIATIFSSNGWCEYQRFMELSHDSSFISSLNISDISNLEGYLFPDTYYFDKDMYGAEKILQTLTSRFHEVWKSVGNGGKQNSSLSREEVVILASLVEKEAAVAQEQPIIAGVFLNRLKREMKLQSDPTVLYGVDGRKRPITKTDLRTKTPYNTYVIDGLPAGPICNPGEGALRAVLRPQQNKYLYFVSNNDGTHTFSENLDAHNNAVQRYRNIKKAKAQEKEKSIVKAEEDQR